MVKSKIKKFSSAMIPGILANSLLNSRSSDGIGSQFEDIRVFYRRSYVTTTPMLDKKNVDICRENMMIFVTLLLQMLVF
jgi:hypothetical protein